MDAQRLNLDHIVEQNGCHDKEKSVILMLILMKDSRLLQTSASEQTTHDLLAVWQSNIQELEIKDLTRVFAL